MNKPGLACLILILIPPLLVGIMIGYQWAYSSMRKEVLKRLKPTHKEKGE